MWQDLVSFFFCLVNLVSLERTAAIWHLEDASHHWAGLRKLVFILSLFRPQPQKYPLHPQFPDSSQNDAVTNERRRHEHTTKPEVLSAYRTSSRIINVFLPAFSFAAINAQRSAFDDRGDRFPHQT